MFSRSDHIQNSNNKVCKNSHKAKVDDVNSMIGTHFGKCIDHDGEKWT